MVRTSIILGAVAIGLLAYILLVEKDRLSTRELEKREHSVLPEMIRAKVSRIEIQRKGESTVLERDLAAMDERGLWQVTKPYAAPADRDAVDTLLGELEWMDSRRKLTDITEGDRRRFGFETPRYRVRFTVGAVEVTALVGNESPRGEGIYVQGRDRSTAFVVGKDLIEALDQEPEHYHTKELHDGLLVATTTGLELRDASGTRAVRRRADRLFELSQGGRGLASEPEIRALLDRLHTLRASRFIATGVGDLKPYGLDAPELELKVVGHTLADDGEDGAAKTKKDDGEESKPGRVPTELRLRLGAACGEHAEERYLTVGEGEDVFCALDADLAPLRQDLEALRERRALPLEDDAVASVRIEGQGRVLELDQDDDGTWSYRVTQGGEKGARHDAREGSVGDWLRAMRALTVERFDAGALAGERIEIQLERRGDQPPFTLEAGTAATHTLLQRDGEDFTVALPPGALELLSPPAVGFRPLTLATHEEAKLTRIEVVRDGVTENVERAGAGAFRVSTPVQVGADRLAAGELARLLSKLEAVRMVADRDRPEHGLAAPVATISAHFGAESVTLEIGGEAQGGRFARLRGDAAVFILPERLWEQVEQPLASRTALAVPLEQIRSIELSAGGRSVSVSGDGKAFSGEGLEASASGALAEAVATLRASVVTGYGEPATAHGFGAPHARLRVGYSEGGGEGAREILIGAEAEQGGRHARRSDLAVGFVLPAAQLEALLGAPR